MSSILSLPTKANVLLDDPLEFKQMCWPWIYFYDKQIDIIESVRWNRETIVPAGNALGKDFIAAFIALWFFCSRSPCRVVTSSVDQPQLKGVLWGEIRRFIQTSRYALPIQTNDLLLRQVQENGELEPLSYLIGRVTRKGEGMLGHHVAKTSDGIPRTLCIGDEASGLDNETWEKADTWAHRKLAIGNPYPCVNFFRQGVKQGDLEAPEPDTRGRKYFYRKVIKIRAEDSPNVRLALVQKTKGLRITREILVPGVLDYEEYLVRRATWDKVKQCIGLDAEFYEGAEVLLYPPDWLDAAERYYDYVQANVPRRNRKAVAMGVDAAEGGDSTVWCIVDRYGILYWLSLKTGDTSDIPGQTIQLMREYRVPPENVLFDRGGGGKQHADLLRKQGYAVRTIGFGEAPTPAIEVQPRGQKTRNETKEQFETKYTYVNRRAEMYGMLRLLLTPTISENTDEPPKSNFGIPRTYTDLRAQLAPIPLKYTEEGRLWLPPKNKKSPDSPIVSLREILGRSPDDADALVLAVYGMLVKAKKRRIGSISLKGMEEDAA